MYSIRNSIVYFDRIEIIKKKFNASKQTINLNLININRMIMSAKDKPGDKSIKYFIGCIDDDVVKP